MMVSVSRTLSGSSRALKAGDTVKVAMQATEQSRRRRSCAIGAKICPSIPAMVNSGTKPAMMIAAEKKIARLTSLCRDIDRAEPAGEPGARRGCGGAGDPAA